MVKNTFTSGVNTNFSTELNENFIDNSNLATEGLKHAGHNIIRQLQDREVVLSADGKYLADAYSDISGRLNSVIVSQTTAVFKTNKYSTDIADEASDDTTTNLSFLNPEFAFDSDDATFANITNDNNGASIVNKYVGKTFSAKNIGAAYVKCSGNTNLGLNTTDRTAILQTYDGTTWTNHTTLFSFTAASSAAYEGYTNINDTIQGIRVIFNIQGGSGNSSNDAYLYTLEYGLVETLEISHIVESGVFSSTISSSYLTALVAEWEEGANVQYKLAIKDAPSGEVDRTQLSFKNVSEDFSEMGSANAIRGAAFSTDGTKLYLKSSALNVVHQYSVATPWDTTTATYDSKTYTITQDTTMYNICFSPDGTKMYGLGGANNNVYQYTLSTAWDVSTASYLTTISLLTAQSYGLAFSPDGSRMFIGEGANDAVYSYTLSTPWLVSSATSDSKSFVVSGQGIQFPYGIVFNSTGTKVFVSENNSQPYQYSLSTPWDVTTMVSLGLFQLTFSAFNMWGDSEGKRLFFDNNNTTSRFIYAYDNWDGSFLEDSGWLNFNEKSEFTPLTAEPDTFIVRLVPKTTTPSAGVPSIYGYTLYEV